MRKVVFFWIFFLYFLTIFQVSFLAHYQFKGSNLNLVLIAIILLNFFEKKDSRFGFWVGLSGGFFLDLFSPFWFGIFVFLGLASVLLIKIFKPFFVTENILSFLVVLLPILFFYYAFLTLVNFSGFNFDWAAVVYNFLAGSVIFFLIKPVYVYFDKRIRK